MGYLIMAGQLMLSLSILIVLHEMGHFLPARLFNTRVEKFYLFFDPWFSLVKRKVGDTEYGIGWLPLGGYVKISGMVDESFDTEQMKQPAQPWEFRSKPAWQRLIIMLGGVTVNFILGFLIFALVLWTWGEEYIPSKNITYGIYADSLGIELGLKDGDHILAIGDKPFEKFNYSTVIREIVIHNAKTITVERDGQELKVPVDEKYVDLLSRHENKDKQLFGARVPFVVAEFGKESPAKKAGLQKEDQIIALNDTATAYFHEFFKRIKNYPGKEVSLKAVRKSENGAIDTLNFAFQTSADGRIGVYPYGEPYHFKTERQDYTLMQAFPAGVTKGMTILFDQLKAFGQIFRGKIKATESLGGFASIGKMFGASWNWERFWTMTAVLSLILAFMNLLPIPALDGGHVLFLLYEIVSGRKPSDKFMEIATMVGFIIVLGLLLFANGLDIKRWLTQ